jgi:tetratricopeptide (TPR) repeat protein
MSAKNLLRVVSVVAALGLSAPAFGQGCETNADLGKQATTAQSAAQSGRHADAVAAADKVLAACPTHPVAVAALGEGLFGQGKTDDVIARMSAALGANSKIPYAYYWRGKAYNAKKQQARMVDDLEAFLKLAPNAPEAGAVKQLLAALR